VLAAARVLPVITTTDVGTTLDLISTLHRGGMRAIEVTLRSRTAVECITEARNRFPELLVAAGTVIDARTLDQAQGAGAQFVVSPGISASLLDAARKSDVAILPGVASASDLMLGMDYGLSNFKFFPAVPAGGIPMLKAFAGPFPAARFCPTGGLGADNFRDFLALPNVICCGGSWMVAGQLVERGNWDEIERLAAESMT
jgi:2-dehydro-3-deoxyphosphogluconate aldolase/(4S)-4-hydroxy-2-oxoglutarate aldolase